MTLRLQDYAARSAAVDPSAIAIVLEDQRLSYGELVSQSRRLARLLLRAGVGPGDRVLLMMPKSPEAIVGMHAILEAGAAYVPVDLASPGPRAARVAAAAEPRAVLAAAQAAKLLDELVEQGALRGVRIVSLDDGWPGGERVVADYGPADWARASDDPIEGAGDPDRLAHILFTSGSTGTPKGVQITHAMVGAFVDWAVQHFATAPGERISAHPPLHFDLSTFDIYATLKARAELHLVPARANLLPAELAGFIRGGELHQWFSVPSTLAFLSGSGALEAGLPSLKRVLFCGEAMPAPVLAEWMRRVPQARYTNLYGPTETTIASSYYDVPPAALDELQPVPIGLPCPGEELIVLDQDLEELEPGRMGELGIAGHGLSPGYWRDDERTAAAFVTRASDGKRIYRTGDLGSTDDRGLFYCAGRTDSQIKHRGYRIELGEIEVALNALDALRECAVVVIDAPGFEANAICCAYAPAGAAVEPPALRAALRRTLPSYMLPTRWLAYGQLPRNANGKLDRPALREQFAADAAERRTDASQL